MANARFKVTVSEQVWRMWDVEIEVDPQQSWLQDLDDSDAISPPSPERGMASAAANDTLLKMAVAQLEDLMARDALPDPEHQESGSFNIEGFDVVVSPHDATVLDLLDLREELEHG